MARETTNPLDGDSPHWRVTRCIPNVVRSFACCAFIGILDSGLKFCQLALSSNDGLKTQKKRLIKTNIQTLELSPLPSISLT